jgi:hypothetical protein
MRNLFYISTISLLSFTSCTKENKVDIKKDIAVVTNQSVYDSKGYELMKNNCFVCHFPKPDPSKRNQMIAPPMQKVQEHYKPAYPNKEEFVKAIKTWVANPSEDKVQMPGVVRKFNLMPKLVVADEDIKLIAETLYEIDFGISPKMHNQNQELQLNNGKKWKLNKTAINKATTIIKKLNEFKSNDVNTYQNFGKEIFDTAKTILLDKNLSAKPLEQLQVFFHNIEGNMHNLMKVKTIDEGKEQQEILKKKFNAFLEYFE